MKNLNKLVLASAAALALSGVIEAKAAYQADPDGDGVFEWVYDVSGTILADDFYPGAHLRGSGLEGTQTDVTDPAVMVSEVDPTMYAGEGPVIVTPKIDGTTITTIEYEVVNGVITGATRLGATTAGSTRQDGKQLVPAADAPARPTGPGEEIDPYDGSDPIDPEVQPVQGDGNNEIIPGEIDYFADIVDITDGSIHVVQQGDLFLRGRVDNPDSIKEVVVRKNNVEIGRGTVNGDGFFVIEFTEPVYYGEQLDVFGIDNSGAEEALSDEVKVDHVGQAHTPAPFEVAYIEDRYVSGYTAPFNKVVINVTDPSSNIVVLKDVITYANRYGFFEIDLGSLVQRGFKVSVQSIDSYGNESNPQEYTVGDKSAIDVAAPRRLHQNDKAITVQTEPYADVLIHVNGQIAYRGKADGNGVARITLNTPLNINDEVEIWANSFGRDPGYHKTTVRRSADVVAPKAPTVDGIVEGGTIISGTAEALSKVEVHWRSNGRITPTVLYAMADIDGNWLIDFFRKGIDMTFDAGDKIHVTSVDDAYNFSAETYVTAVASDTKKYKTNENIVIDPNAPEGINLDEKGKDQLDPNQNPVENPEKPGEEKPGEEKPGEEKPGEEKPGEEKPGEEKPGSDSKKDSAKKSSLPETGESNSYAIFGAAALAVLAGVGLVAPSFKKEN